MKLIGFLLIILMAVACSDLDPEIKEYDGSADHALNYEAVEFMSTGAQLRGRLYTPESFDEALPIVVMAHGFSATIEGMTADKYAEEFCRAGFAVLLFDHRNFGSSGGEPRQEINFWVQVRGYIDAVDHVQGLEFIDHDKIALWGCSLSGAEAFTAASYDPRISAIVAQVPGFGDDPIQFDSIKAYERSVSEILFNDSLHRLEKNQTEAMAIVSPYQESLPSALKELSAFRWFMEYGARFGTQWQNSVSFSRFEKAPSEYRVGMSADLLDIPCLLLVAKKDEMEGASELITRSIFERLTADKQLVELDGGHFGLLHYPSEIFNHSSKAQVEFLQLLFKAEK